jgi:hypothetical protein
VVEDEGWVPEPAAEQVPGLKLPLDPEAALGMGQRWEAAVEVKVLPSPISKLGIRLPAEAA